MIISDFGKGIADLKLALTPHFTSRPDLERAGMGLTIIQSLSDSFEIKSVLNMGTKLIIKKKVVSKDIEACLDEQGLYWAFKKAQQGDERALEKCYTENKLLIMSLLGRFHYNNAEKEDLFQVASMGLIKAIQNFNVSYNVEFSTYAVPLILGEIRRYFRESSTLKVARSIKELSSKIASIESDYLKSNNCVPSVNYLSEKLNVSVEDIMVALDSRNPVTSLDDPLRDDNSLTLADTLGENDQKLMSEYLDIHMAMEKLNRKEQLFVHLRFYEGLTQSEIAQRLFTSQVQISRLENLYLKNETDFIKSSLIWFKVTTLNVRWL